MIKIFIADDHAVVRRGLKQIISETPDMLITAEAEKGEELLSRLFKENCDIVLLDISMPGASGLEVLKQLKKRKPKLPVLMLSIYPEEQYAIRALKAGASGYLTKESAPEELVAAIRKIYKGGKYVSSELAEKIIEELNVFEEKQTHKTLSNREYQIMCMFASGKKLKDIANALSLSVQTVSTYKNRILDKMKMKSITEIVRYAVRNRLVE